MSKPNNSHINPTSFVPPGRTLADMPKAEPKPAPNGAQKPPNTNLTIGQYLTEGGNKSYLVEFLKEKAKGKKGPWRDYLSFYAANHSGDMNGVSGPTKAKVEKMVKELNDSYLESQDL